MTGARPQGYDPASVQAAIVGLSNRLQAEPVAMVPRVRSALADLEDACSEALRELDDCGHTRFVGDTPRKDCPTCWRGILADGDADEVLSAIGSHARDGARAPNVEAAESARKRRRAARG